MLDKKWISNFTELANLVASWSKDPSTKVGAVIFDARRTIIGVGFNGFPRGVNDDAERYTVKSVKYKLIVHSEANAILNANKPVRECGMLTTKYPCSECAKLITQSGITDVYTPPPDKVGLWFADAEFSKSIFSESGVTIHELTPQYHICPVQSNECEIRGRCTNKCGRLNPTGIPTLMEEADND